MSATAPKPEPQMLDVPTAAEWERWLDAHHDETPEGVWLRLCSKGKSDATPTYAEAVEIALCFGWIDGQAKKYDDVSRVQRFTPRRARSVWSKRNTERAEQLVAAGRMRPAGQREIDRAKADGRWARAYDPPSTATVPDDFMVELAKNRKAMAFFETLTKRNTYPIVHRLQTAKRPETRAKRIHDIIAMFERGEKFHE